MHRISREFIYFTDPLFYQVAIAGDWNRWAGAADGSFNPDSCLMEMNPLGEWFFSLAHLSDGRHEFKFIRDGEWETGENHVIHIRSGCLYDPSLGVLNAYFIEDDLIFLRIDSLRNHTLSAFKLDPEIGLILTSKSASEITLKLEEKAEISRNYQLLYTDGFEQGMILVDWGRKLKSFYSEKRLGSHFAQSGNQTVFRVFAPRATEVSLLIYGEVRTSDPRACGETEPEVFQMMRSADGVWETGIAGDLRGFLYRYRVDGPAGEGEGFSERPLSDPYALVNLYHDGPSMVYEGAFEFSAFSAPAPEDLLIYELHLRDFTVFDKTIRPELRGKYLGFLDTVGRDTGIGYLKKLGVNAVEFLPLHEFDEDPPGEYHWGYMSSLFFCPEAQYATSCYGGQVSELKAMVELFHKNGLAVILDVVYNHTGKPDHLAGFDSKYYYRQGCNYTRLNFSCCGNDLACENPMVRKMILDSLKYFLTEFRFDGFRFDLAELVGVDTLKMVEVELKKINPGVYLIAEPWSTRGDIKFQLKGSAFSSWNDFFRDRVRNFLLTRIQARELEMLISGSTGFFTAKPVQSVNYLECHDGYTLIDALNIERNFDGSAPDEISVKRAQLGAGLIFMSLGVPMISQGQELLRSKQGNGNSFDSGDTVNGIDWELKKKNSRIFELYRKLISIRNHQLYGPILKNSGGCSKCVFDYDPSNPQAICYRIYNCGSAMMMQLNGHPELSAEFSDLEISGVLLCDSCLGSADLAPAAQKIGPLDFRIYYIP
ncbi:MAG: alpha-amylase family glycosyl hydrolase [Candidatus Wallbacteria bacterium]|nr:alpha-amylase family glycosyl hydrolase [Candidatus Wallbacteria bacterium]